MDLRKFLRTVPKPIKSSIFTPKNLIKYCTPHQNSMEFFPHSLFLSNLHNIPSFSTEEAETISKLDYALSNANLSDDLVHGVLKKLNNSGIMALAFFRWAENRKGFQHTPECYNALIESLGKIRQFKMVWLLVDEMNLKGILGKGTFALICRRLLRARKVKEAIAAFASMEKKHGLKPELQDYNRMLDNLSKSNHVGVAHQLFDAWKNKMFTPNVQSYTILLEGWGQERNFLKVNKVYCEMRNIGCEPDAVTYGILINAYCKARKHNDAVALYNEMETTGTKATPHIFSTLIHSLGTEGRLHEAVRYFSICRTSGCGINIPTYNALVSAYCCSGRVHDAYKLVDEMRACGIRPNTHTYDVILQHLAKSLSIEEACSFFEKMNDEPGCEPGVSTYEIMVRMFCNEGRVDMALNVWDQMKGRGVVPRMEMFAVLIDCLCNCDKVGEACKYMQEMLEMGMRPRRGMFCNLKKFLVDAGKEEIVILLAHKIEKLRKNQLIG